MADNAKIEVKGDVLVITVDLSKDLARSASGKSILTAKTRGAEKLPSGHSINLQVYRKP